MLLPHLLHLTVISKKKFVSKVVRFGKCSPFSFPGQSGANQLPLSGQLVCLAPLLVRSERCPR